MVPTVSEAPSGLPKVQISEVEPGEIMIQRGANKMRWQLLVSIILGCAEVVLLSSAWLLNWQDHNGLLTALIIMAAVTLWLWSLAFAQADGAKMQKHRQRTAAEFLNREEAHRD